MQSGRLLLCRANVYCERKWSSGSTIRISALDILSHVLVSLIQFGIEFHQLSYQSGLSILQAHPHNGRGIRHSSQSFHYSRVQLCIGHMCWPSDVCCRWLAIVTILSSCWVNSGIRECLRWCHSSQCTRTPVSTWFESTGSYLFYQYFHAVGHDIYNTLVGGFDWYYSICK